jgi:hypothetical protein
MKNADVFDAINSLEQRFPVQAWRSDDIDLWPTYRFRLYANALASVLQQQPVRVRAPGARELAARVSRALLHVPHAALRDWRRNASVRAGTEAVFFSDGVSFVRLDDAWFDRVVDPVMQALEERGHHTLKLTPLSYLHIPRHVPSRFIQPAIDRIKVTATFRSAPIELPEFEKFQDMARELLGDIAPTLKWLSVQAARLQGLAQWFGRVFDRAGASHAFVNTYYSLEGLAFVQAARRRGMRSVDLQHGIQGPHHIAYARWANTPSRGYSTLPDEFWVWGEEEVATIDAWRSGCATHVARTTGNFWLQRWFDDADPLVASYLQQARALRGSRPQVMVCVVWGVPEEETTKLIEAAKLCGSSIAWWWRLHPVMADQKDEFARRLESNGLDGSQVRQATDLPLFALLRFADLNVAHSSTVIREAADLGVPSVITSDYGAELHSALIGRGVALHATDERAIAAAIQTLAVRERRIGAVASADRHSLQALVDSTFNTRPSAVPRQGVTA